MNKSWFVNYFFRHNFKKKDTMIAENNVSNISTDNTHTKLHTQKWLEAKPHKLDKTLKSATHCNRNGLRARDRLKQLHERRPQLLNERKAWMRRARTL